MRAARTFRRNCHFCGFVLYVTFHMMLGKHNLFASYEALMLSFTGNFLSSIVNKDIIGIIKNEPDSWDTAHLTYGAF